MFIFSLRFGIEDGSRDQSALSAFPALGFAIGLCLLRFCCRFQNFALRGLIYMEFLSSLVLGNGFHFALRCCMVSEGDPKPRNHMCL